MSLHKLLIANRGEIAIRIARAAGEAGLVTVAIHPSGDALSLHVRAADEAYEIPGRGARAYLDIEAVVAAAKATGCDALHPVRVCQDLAEVAHVEPLSAARTLHQMIGLSSSDAICINAGLDHRDPTDARALSSLPAWPKM